MSRPSFETEGSSALRDGNNNDTMKLQFRSGIKTNTISTSMPQQTSHSNYSQVNHQGKFSEDDFQGKDNDSVTITRTTFLCENLTDGGKIGFISIPHLGLHGRGSTLFVSRIFERWLLDPALRSVTGSSNSLKSETFPVVNLSGDELVSSFTALLKQEVRSNGVSLSDVVSVRLRFGLTRFLKDHCNDQGVLTVCQKAGPPFPFYIEASFQTVSLHANDCLGDPGTPTSPIFSPFNLSAEDSIDLKSVLAITPVINSEQSFTEIKFDVLISHP
ncbi:hypothetical protein DSO57_1004886 [Entomophthora muscae]|uniref:Uncharacterized protein n=1 Tax=Entomophthora muscae TaxID=34485 RepID=A0ACC2TVI5_9FUNG|nr:hypothetical protein DSO57_1004886 [Entomophthora muscae]